MRGRTIRAWAMVVATVWMPLWAQGQQRPTRPERFLMRYEAFVNEVTALPFDAFHGDTLVKVQREEHRFIRRYNWYYSKRLSVEQVEQFGKLRGRYRRKITALNNRRRLAAFKGRVEGFFYRDTTRRDTLAVDTVFVE